MASENSSSSDNACSCRFEYTAAYWVLRLFLGLRTFMAGVEKYENKGTYSVANYRQNMDHMAEGITGASFLPLWATKAFAHSIGYVLLALGALLLLGVKPRVTLTLTGFVYVGLSFGLMAVQEQQGLAWLGTYLGLIAGALVLSRHDRLCVWRDRS
jgi:thiosulfate dehydrogenase [quinone] large subunit